MMKDVFERRIRKMMIVVFVIAVSLLCVSVSLRIHLNNIVEDNKVHQIEDEIDKDMSILQQQIDNDFQILDSFASVLEMENIVDNPQFPQVLSDANEQKELQVLNTLLAKQVDGIIFMGNKITDELRKQIDKTKTPVVLAGSLDDKEEFESVHINYVDAVEEAVSEQTAFVLKIILIVVVSEVCSHGLISRMVKTIGAPASFPVIETKTITARIIVGRTGDDFKILQITEFAKPLPPNFSGNAEHEISIVLRIKKLSFHDL